uniref:LIM zinc-binding domain-containing protein n=1 Tax=Amorphochlora amoebiformis TaxID=1561963 RepID=A0A7S0DSD6_9EUKA
MSVKSGTILSITDIEDGWGMATLPSGKQGWVPVAFFEKYTPPLPAKSASQTKTESNSGLAKANSNTSKVVGRDHLSKAWQADQDDAMSKLGYGKVRMGVRAATRTKVTKKTGPGVSVFCKECGDQIVGRVFSSGNDSWCSKCFVCSKCNIPIADTPDKSFLFRNGAEIWCKKCDKWDKKINGSGAGPKASSGAAIGEGKRHGGGFIRDKGVAAHNAEVRERNEKVMKENNEKLKAKDQSQGGKVYCAMCNNLIEGHGVQDGEVFYHPSCWTCAACSCAIGAGEFVRHLGKPYHTTCFKAINTSGMCGVCGKPIAGKFFSYKGKKIHKKCFKCDMCAGSLAGGFAERGSQKLCGSCIKKNPKRPTRSVAKSASKGIKFDHWKGKVVRGGASKKSHKNGVAYAKFCSSCGAKGDGGKFCSSCGSKMQLLS